MHSTFHIANPVAVDQHHSHDRADARDDSKEVPMDQDRPGHDHMPGVSASFSATLNDGPRLVPPFSATMPTSVGAAPVLRDILPSPPARPPRAS